jgi:hypothetical protein
MIQRFIRQNMPAAAKAGSLCFALGASALVSADDHAPLIIKDQGSLIAGGGLITQPGTFDPYKPLMPDGQTYHGDHVYAFYQVPVDARPLPILMLHGAGQSAKSWETTADGREGFQNIFLRRGFSTYLIDQPRRGDAGRSLVETTIKPVPDEQLWFNQFRIGLWPEIVAFEPGSSFVFPEGEVPAPIASAFDTLTGQAVSAEQFKALTNIPIVIFYGDNIPDQPVRLPAQDSWRARLEMARLWRDTVNRHGGDVRLVHLPEIGIKGNSHFPFSDMNNVEIADLVSQFLAEKNLD